MNGTNESMEVKVQAYQVIEKTVKASGNSGRVYVPPEWIGKKVKVFLLESVPDKDEHINKRKTKDGDKHEDT